MYFPPFNQEYLYKNKLTSVSLFCRIATFILPEGMTLCNEY